MRINVLSGPEYISDVEPIMLKFSEDDPVTERLKYIRSIFVAGEVYNKLVNIWSNKNLYTYRSGEFRPIQIEYTEEEIRLIKSMRKEDLYFCVWPEVGYDDQEYIEQFMLEWKGMIANA